MDLEKTLEKINKDRYKAECGFVFSLWKDPELFIDYLNINEGKDQTLKDKDAKFYFGLGKALYKAGYRTFDGISIDTFLTSKPNIKKAFEEKGGMATVEELKSMVNTSNVDAFYDSIAKKNSLSLMAEKYEDIFSNLERFDNATNDDVYNAFELLNSSISIATSNDVKIEDLKITDKYLDDCDRGVARGLDYGASCPILNHITLGIPRGDLTMFAGMSGTGKSSFVFENVILPLCQKGIKTAIISNEMKIDVYQSLLTVHILTKEMNYWNLTRKKLKGGSFTEEQKEKLAEAQKICEEKYSGIKFVKMFENETTKITKYMRKLAHQGFDVIFLDTFKADDSSSVNEQMWVTLLQNSRKIFNLASRYNVAIITTYQLNISTASNMRYLDSSALSSSKQIKEVYSELIMMRKLWRNEYSGEKYDCKPYTLKKNENGRWEKDASIELDSNKTYLVMFIDKTRNDEDNQQILYRFDGQWNKWTEVGYCHIHSDQKG